MQKVLRYVLMTVLALCFCVPAFSSAEAATVALLPLINNANDEMANQVYYKEAINKLNGAKGFVLVENDALTAAIEANTTPGEVPTAEQMAKIAKDGDVEIVFAMKVDQLSKNERHLSRERIARLVVKGEAVAYNSINGALYKHSINSEKQMDVALMSRFDRLHEEFGRVVRLEVDRALRAK